MSKSKLLTRGEAYALMLFGALALVWGLIVNPYLQSADWFMNLNPVFAYILYNMGTYFLITVIFGIPSALVMKRKFQTTWLDIVFGGLLSFLLFSNVLDMWAPPLAWTINGTALLPLSSSALENTSVDYVYGWIWQSAGLPVSLTYIFVYAVVPMVTLLGAAIVYGQKEFFALIKKI